MRKQAEDRLWPKAEKLLARKKYAEALDPLRDLLAVSPGHEEGRGALAEALRRTARKALARGERDRAATLAREWANVAPDDSRAFELLGDVASRTGEHAEAEAAYRQALALRPRSRSLRKKLRRARIRARRKKAAARDD